MVYDLKNNSLFCNDLTGNYFADCGYHIILHPPDSQFFVEYEYIKELLKNPPAHLYLGHFGIIEDAPAYLKETFEHETWMIEECKKCIESGHPEKVMETIRDKNLESAKNLFKRNDQKLYDYCTKEHIPPQAQTFADLFLSRYSKLPK